MKKGVNPIMTATFLYVTAGSQEEAIRIGRAMVGERLAACANVLPAVTAIYNWDGAPREDREAVLILKTRRALVGDAISRIKTLHSYECPCVVSLPIDGGNPDFLDWIEKETSQETEK